MKRLITLSAILIFLACFSVNAIEIQEQAIFADDPTQIYGPSIGKGKVLDWKDDYYIFVYMTQITSQQSKIKVKMLDNDLNEIGYIDSEEECQIEDISLLNDSLLRVVGTRYENDNNKQKTGVIVEFNLNTKESKSNLQGEFELNYTSHNILSENGYNIYSTE